MGNKITPKKLISFKKYWKKILKKTKLGKQL